MKTNLGTNHPESKVVSPGSTYFAELIQAAKATPTHEIDHFLQILEANKLEWATLEITDRLQLLDEVRKDLRDVQDQWVQSEQIAKGLPDGSFGMAEEWILLAQAFRAINQIQRSLKGIQSQGAPPLSGPIAPGPEDQSVLRVFPQTLYDRLIFFGVTGDVWLKPGVKIDDVSQVSASRYRDLDYRGGVALVLGAGNVSMIPFCDALLKLFVDLQVVILKMNPVNAHLGPLIEKCFRSLIERGFLRVAYGGPEVGAYVCNHPIVEEIHMTGSDKTYEAIVFGTGSEGQRRKIEREPLNLKPFTGELGNVTPVIVVPGPWSEGDIEEYAKHFGTWLVANAGFACLIPRVLIQHKSWDQRGNLANAIRRRLDQYPTRLAYYPGAFQIHEDYLKAHPEADLMGSPDEDQLPWTLIPDVNPENINDISFKREAWGGICAEVNLEAESIGEYLDRAVEFANSTLWGTLCAILLVHPKSFEDPMVSEAVDRAIENLHYGTVSINMLAFYSSYYMVTPWGAPPGHDIYDIQSGKGKNFNFLMLEETEKVVVKAPFRRIDPIRISNKRAHIFSKKLAAFEESPSWLKLANVMLEAVRS